MEATIVLAVVIGWVAAATGAAFLLGAVIRRANQEQPIGLEARIDILEARIDIIHADAVHVDEPLARTGTD